MSIDMRQFKYERVNVFVMRIQQNNSYIDTHYGNDTNSTFRFTNENMEEMVDIVNDNYENRAFPLMRNQKDIEKG